MYKFGARSKERLRTVNGDLQRVIYRVLEVSKMDLTVLEGVRSKDRQDQLKAEGKSQLSWPNSKHNVLAIGDLSLACDIAPYINGSIPWDDPKPWHRLAGMMEAVSADMGIDIRWGGDWDGNAATKNRFNDYPHFELANGEG